MVEVDFVFRSRIEVRENFRVRSIIPLGKAEVARSLHNEAYQEC